MKTSHTEAPLRIVIKIGTNVLTRADGVIDITTMSQIADQIYILLRRGHKIILISSGAVGSGRGMIPHLAYTSEVVKKQIWAAVGQVRLMNVYADLFQRFGIYVAQVLATKEDFRDRQHYLNMKNCINGLLADQIIPIINENDVVSVSELMFTDNDELAGLVSAMIDAHKLILLSNIDGIYDGAPSDPGSRIIPLINADEEADEKRFSAEKSSFGRGGMLTKFRFARKAARLGIDTCIANGKMPDILLRIADGKEAGTRFISHSPVSGIKKWLAYAHTAAAGKITINKGAVEALYNPSRITSLLPVGVIKMEGHFKKGDLVEICNEEGKNIGIGKIRFDAPLAETMVRDKASKSLIHYDYLQMI